MPLAQLPVLSFTPALFPVSFSDDSKNQEGEKNPEAKDDTRSESGNSNDVNAIEGAPRSEWDFLRESISKAKQTNPEADAPKQLEKMFEAIAFNRASNVTQDEKLEYIRDALDDKVIDKETAKYLENQPPAYVENTVEIRRFLGDGVLNSEQANTMMRVDQKDIWKLPHLLGALNEGTIDGNTIEELLKVPRIDFFTKLNAQDAPTESDSEVEGIYRAADQAIKHRRLDEKDMATLRRFKQPDDASMAFDVLLEHKQGKISDDHRDTLLGLLRKGDYYEALTSFSKFRAEYGRAATS